MATLLPEAREPAGGSAPSDWATLAAEIDRLNRSDPRRALEMAERWLAREEAAGSVEGRARAMRSHAHALRFLGRHDEAIAQYDEAEPK